MQATRRAFVGAMGATTAVAAASRGAKESHNFYGQSVCSTSRLLRLATRISDLDEAVYKDMLSSTSKESGADGVVGAGNHGRISVFLHG